MIKANSRESSNCDRVSNPRVSWLKKSLKGYTVSTLRGAVKVRQPREELPPFMLVVGSGRAGNTLFRRLMMERLSIYLPPETYALHKIADYRVRARGLGWPAIADLVVATFEYHPEFSTFDISNLRAFAIHAKTWNREKQTLAGLLDSLYRWLSVQAQCESAWVGDKTPLNTMHLGPISKVLPHVHYIYLLRDGADVITSYVETGLYDSVYAAAERWLQSLKSWMVFTRTMPPNRHLTVRYEDLVNDPEQSLERVRSAFHIPRRDNEKDVRDILGDATKREHHANSFEPITTDSIGKGRRLLSQSSRSRLRPLMNNTLVEFGYEPL